jgi:hypothetical protein
LSNQYQYEEYEKFKLEGVKIKDTEKWLPEFAFEYIDKYISPHLDTSAALNKIAYYSHGSWIRKKQNHAKNKLTIFEDEQKILNFLNTYIQRYPELSLSIYTHPRERKEEFRQEAQRFYKQHLPDITFSFPENDKKTADCFNEADIAICAYSSVIYERLFCGFKTLVGLPATSGFPMKESKLNNIVFKSYAEMEEKINFSRLLPAKQFFESYQLKGYAFYDYPYFKTHEYQ